MVRQIVVSPQARARSTLARIDYTDGFLAEPGPAGQRTAEQWARAVLEDAPAARRRSLQSGWLALGLELDLVGSGESILGWQLRRSTPEFALLGVESRVGMPAELLFECGPDGVLLATFVQQGNPAVRALWAGVAPVHRRIVPKLLERATQAAVVQ